MYRKFTAPNLFTGEVLLPEGHVLITDTNGLINGIVKLADAGEDVEHFAGILSPGFINAHCHLELSHLKGRIPQKTGLVDFVFKIITERHFETAEILTAIEAAENDMLQSGIVAVGDICNNSLTITQKQKERLRYHNFIEVSGFVPQFAKDRFEKAKAIEAEFKSNIQYHKSNITPHSPYSVSKQLFELINDDTAESLIAIHNQETIAEEEFMKSKTGDFLNLYTKLGIDISFFNPSGKSSLQTWWPYLNKKQSAILVHNVTTSAEDIKSMQVQNPKSKNKNWFCLCPNANLYITNTLPDVTMLIENQCNIVLGTDSLASNHQLDIMEEIKTLQQHFPKIPFTTMLQWATINGAKALQMEDTLGSFEKGKQPGIVIIENLENAAVNSSASSRRIL